MNIGKRIVEFNGVTHTLAEWGRKLGIRHSTLANRLEAGWTVEAAFLTKTGPTFNRNPDKKVTKNDAELLLNETRVENLPSILKAVIPISYEGVRVGSFLRNNHRETFDRWFDTQYYPAHTK